MKLFSKDFEDRLESVCPNYGIPYQPTDIEFTMTEIINFFVAKLKRIDGVEDEII